MHLSSVTLKGFKSFPDRTRLEFAPGVAVIVGPNGSGKSNITEGILWALGEQSPLAVRGQSMQDVIFAGGRGTASRAAAEVEVVLSGAEDAGPGGFSELSISRRLDREGDGEYRLNGARCRLVDVLEALADTGLGKEMHSVVSQGRVETIIHSRPRDRRLLIEEAAGLGKHRRRRRRAQLKLERTEQNLARALDVEREARARLRPLKRQAEAAELHERIERQSDEARLELAVDRARSSAADLAEAETAAAAARHERDRISTALSGVGARREAAEAAFAAHAREREALAARHFSARSALERVELRAERASEIARAAADGGARRAEELAALAGGPDPDGLAAAAAARSEALESELAALDAERGRRLEEELAGLDAERAEAEERRAELERTLAARRASAEAAEAAAEEVRRRRREAERTAEAARARAAAVGSELAATTAALRRGLRPPGGARTLAEDLGAEPGYEQALAAALGSRLSAAVVSDLVTGEALLDRAGRDGASALLARPPEAEGVVRTAPPAAGARPLRDHVRAEPAVAPIVDALLADTWVVERFEGLAPEFAGLAVSRAGRVLDARAGAVTQAPRDGEADLLERRNRREELAGASAAAAAAETEARAAVDAVAAEIAAADAAREKAEEAVRAASSDLDEAAWAVGRIEALAKRRREAPDEGPGAVRRAACVVELSAERRVAEGARREAVEREGRRARLAGRVERDRRLAASGEIAAAALAAAAEALRGRRDELAAELEGGAAAGERTAAELRACAGEESELTRRLTAAGDALTAADVRAARARDEGAGATAAVAELRARLGDEAAPADSGEPLGPDRRAELERRIERLARRREQLGPVNPLAGAEWEEALAHVEELEGQRGDLEAALAELAALVRDIDARIRTDFSRTFEDAARNFEEVVGELFPGGRGRLRLVDPRTPRGVLGDADPDARPAEIAGGFGDRAAGASPGSAADPGGSSSGEGGPAEAGADGAEQDEATVEEDPGVEVEVTPAGKATRRLSLLSGGEKSLVALAFLFAVFLARPCPFYVLDEVEAALDDHNVDRFLRLVRRFSDRAQFIVVTHQRRTMDAADRVYGVSMAGDGVSKVVSRRLPAEAGAGAEPDAAVPSASVGA